MFSAQPTHTGSRNANLLVWLTLLLGLLVTAAAIWQREQQRMQDVRLQAYAAASDRTRELDSQLRWTLSAVYGLEALVRQARGPVPQFEQIAAHMLPHYPGASVLIQAPEGVISDVAPLKGNEAALGLNLLQDPVMRQEADLARRTGQLTLAGPLPLRQGGVGLVARLPIYLDDAHHGKTFWGLVNVVIKLPEALGKAHPAILSNQGYRYKLWRVRPETGAKQIIAESDTEDLISPVQSAMGVPNGAWTLGVVPADGWQNYRGIFIQALGGILLSLLVAQLVRLQLRLRAHKNHLEHLVHARTLDIYESRVQLAVTLEAIPDPLFEMGIDGYFHSCHAPHGHALGSQIEAFAGHTVSEVMPHVAAGLVLHALSEADATGYSSGQQFTLSTPDGERWFELSVARKPEAEDTTPRFIVIWHDVTERHKAQEEVANLAYFDSLTGLPNRAMLNARMASCLRQAQSKNGTACVLFLDLDHFKNVNDRLGHSHGDRLLCVVAQRMQARLRKDDTIARLGGDEFVILLPDTTTQIAAQVAAQLIAAISEPIYIDAHESMVTPSIGIAAYPEHGTDGETLAKHADLAMYRAKALGRNRCEIFNTELEVAAARALWMGHELHRAMDREQLELHYQPKLSVCGRHVLGVEALVRWNHPEFGDVSPVEFIPLAESNGDILAIGRWVLETALTQARKWYDMGFTELVVAVNVSPMQFHQIDLPEMVRSALERTGLPPHLLEVELTESVAHHDAEAAVVIMDKLHQQGVQLAIDDFGTGYSSLSYLKRFAANRLKIDRSFVTDICHDPDDLAIVRAIISMARSMGMKTIAEGVETPAQLALLQAEHCDEVQGHWLCQPLSAEKITTYLLLSR